MKSGGVLCVIPSRLGAVRFPGKPLALIAGKPLVQWVWQAANEARRVDRVVVATDSTAIAAAVRGFGGEAWMTPASCPSGTDRVARVARQVPARIVVNVQGDEPLMAPETIDRTVEALIRDRDADMSTAVRPADDEKEWRDPNVVKAVLDGRGRALYFSRAPIPWPRETGSASAARRWVHMGLYAYRRPFLLRFSAWPPSPLEKTESLEQLRVMERGGRIAVVAVSHRSQAVDHPRDVKRVERILAQQAKTRRNHS